MMRTILVAALLLLAMASTNVFAGEGPGLPNLILMIADDLGRDSPAPMARPRSRRRTSTHSREAECISTGRSSWPSSCGPEPPA